MITESDGKSNERYFVLTERKIQADDEVFCGLRGQASSVSTAVLEDETREEPSLTFPSHWLLDILPQRHSS